MWEGRLPRLPRSWLLEGRPHQACQAAFSYKHNDNFLRKQGMSRHNMVKLARLHKQFLSRNENQVEGCTPSYNETKAKEMYPTPFWFNNLFMSAYINSGSKGVAVVRAVVRALASHECGPGFKSGRRRHMWVGFVFGSPICTESFLVGFSGIFSLSNNLFFTGS